jgi:hypothetical protein
MQVLNPGVIFTAEHRHAENSYFTLAVHLARNAYGILIRIIEEQNAT